MKRRCGNPRSARGRENFSGCYLRSDELFCPRADKLPCRETAIDGVRNTKGIAPIAVTGASSAVRLYLFLTRRAVLSTYSSAVFLTRILLVTRVLTFRVGQ